MMQWMKKTMKSKVVLAVAAGAIMVGMLAGCGQQAQDEKVLRVGSETTYPPFEFSDNGEYKGFDIDLTKAIAKKIGYKYEFKSMGFDALIPALNGNQIDMIAAAINATPERAKVVAFSKPYFKKTGFTILVNTNNTNINSWEDLEGKTIAAQIGTVPADMAKAVKGATAKDLDTIPQMMDEVKMGKSDAAIVDKAVAMYYLNQGDTAKHLKMVGKAESPDGVVFAFRKSDTELQQKVDKAVEELQQDGTYQQIYEKWFGKDEAAK